MMKIPKKAATLLVRIIYPCRCIGCTKLLDIDEDPWLCTECARDFGETEGYRCESCGRLMDRKGKCSDCSGGNIYFDKGYCVLDYKGAVRDAILRYKYKNKFRYAKYFGSVMSQYAIRNFLLGYDYVTAVPLHKTRFKERGYDQAMLIARILAKSIGSKYKRLLIRQRATVPQNSLNKKQRQKNIKNAFKTMDNVNIKGKRILVVDDIFTTGATMNECCRMLRKSGAYKIDFIALSSRSLEE